jgi:hypothetical protein
LIDVVALVQPKHVRSSQARSWNMRGDDGEAAESQADALIVAHEAAVLIARLKRSPEICARCVNDADANVDVCCHCCCCRQLIVMCCV